jgi:hypothetical protein
MFTLKTLENIVVLPPSCCKLPSGPMLVDERFVPDFRHAGLSGCGAALGQCLQVNYANQCYCRTGYDQCVSNLGCPQTTINAVIQACENSGCSTTQVRRRCPH